MRKKGNCGRKMEAQVGWGCSQERVNRKSFKREKIDEDEEYDKGKKNRHLVSST